MRRKFYIGYIVRKPGIPIGIPGGETTRCTTVMLKECFSVLFTLRGESSREVIGHIRNHPSEQFVRDT